MAKDLTELKLASLISEKHRPEKRRETPDGKVRGLYFIIQPSGKASWAFRYRFNGAPKKLTLGDYPGIDLKKARERAFAALVDVAKGGDPAREKRQARKAARVKAVAETIEDVAARFIARHAREKTRASSCAETERILKKEIVGRWKGQPLTAIRRADVHALLDQIVDRGSPIMANKTLAIFRRMCSRAVERDIIANSPCAGIKAPGIERSRDRILDDEELRLVWQACEEAGWPFGPLLQLLILTGQRRDEVAGMRWSEIDFDKREWILPKARVKNDVQHVVPLSTPALQILESLPKIAGDFVFTTTGRSPVSGFSRAKARIDDRLSPEGEAAQRWTLHDLRRTFASGCARIGINLPTIEKILNHTSGSFAGVVGVYQRHSYANEKRDALEAWGRFIEQLVSGQRATNIVKLSNTRGA